MPTSRKLKVFRTTSGFYDAYVAASSQKAALEAWGAATDLFAMGAAERVTDPKLIEPALARPGEVLKVRRGSPSEHLAAASENRRPAKRAGHAASARSDPSETRPKPRMRRPSRTKLEQAEQALASFEDKAEAELAALRERERELAKERDALEARLSETRQRHDRRVERARSAFEEALAVWRDQ